MLKDEVGFAGRGTLELKAVALMGPRAWAEQFDASLQKRLRALACLPDPEWVTSLDDPRIIDHLAELDVLLTGWGAPKLDGRALDRMPRLSTVLHCAGSVREVVSEELWDRGIAVSTSADLNAEPVAEFTFAAIVLAGKKAPFLAMDARHHREDWSYRAARGSLGNVGLTVGLIGFSRVGRRVAQLVRQLHDVTCLVSDPYADPAEVAAEGATLIDLDEMLPRVQVLSIHAPQLPTTHHMIGAEQLDALADHATVINTARGSLVDTTALEQACASGRLHAILDVTDPEPLPASSLLYQLPNVMLTPHISGSLGGEARRMADGALDELERLALGLPLARRVNRDEAAVSA
ncbi:hydroxyacid dehydrogenase [Pseudactinotalea terrae]|uniref:hydroxyacid dehydrogenase n=1 Tax=Pseudactinotalea terrae TaxID=1743262 RepID=UPI001F4FF545|nr:hydroxyacid dehydrogenase [Pseudactinotalea terrae]